MALLPILEFPDPRLRTRAEPVTVFDAALLRLVDDMFETMYAAPGIGLAASQVDVHRQLIVMDVSNDRSQPLVFINPQILGRSEVGTMEEGCLSVPGIFDTVERAQRVRVRAQDRHGVVARDPVTGEWRFVFESSRGEVGEREATLLPCALLERIEREARSTQGPLSIVVSGQVTRYAGRAYLLPTVVEPMRSGRLLGR